LVSGGADDLRRTDEQYLKAPFCGLCGNSKPAGWDVTYPA
jgi:hypothetical protein